MTCTGPHLRMRCPAGAGVPPPGPDLCPGRPQEKRTPRIIFVDAITDVGPDVMDQLPELKMIHSEGVGYNCIDCQAPGSGDLCVQQ